MTDQSRQTYARLAGVLYLIIIVLGLSSELFIRGRLIVPGDAAATAQSILGAEMQFRLSIIADTVMALCDVALALLLYVLLKPVAPTLSLVATGFRLMQTAILGANMLNLVAALILLTGGVSLAAFGADQVHALALVFLDLHSHGYDLGLIFFGVHCALLGTLIYKSGFLPRALGLLVMGAAAAYLIGSFTRFIFPQFVELISPIYLVAIVAEVSLCLWLLLKGVGPLAQVSTSTPQERPQR